MFVDLVPILGLFCQVYSSSEADIIMYMIVETFRLK